MIVFCSGGHELANEFEITNTETQRYKENAAIKFDACGVFFVPLCLSVS
jgi:hypothetical protein